MSLDNLEPQERKKRRREWIAIVLVGFLFLILTLAEFKLSKISNTLPFVNSIFFFGLLNLNLILLLLLVWLVSRNIGKLFLERRQKVLGARLKTKLVLAFIAFAGIPTLALFTISALYINSSFDKWFSLKVQNTLQASLEITRAYYRNADRTGLHFAEHIARGVGKRLPLPIQSDSPLTWPTTHSLLESPPKWMSQYLEDQRELLALDAVEFYYSPLSERVLASQPYAEILPEHYPRLSIDILNQSFFSGQTSSVIEHVGEGDLVRSLVPVRAHGATQGKVIGIILVSTYIPVSLVNKVGEISSVFADYKLTNPLKYPMKTMYFVILVLVTLVVLFVAIWIGLFLARQLTVPVERLVQGAQEVGSGNLDVSIASSGHDEIATLVESFNKMTLDLRENRSRLTQASADLEKRRAQLETVLANVGTGVIVVDQSGEITTFNRAVSHLLNLSEETVLGKNYEAVFSKEDYLGLQSLIQKTLESTGESEMPSVLQWTFRLGEAARSLAAVASPLYDRGQPKAWGGVIVIDDITHLVKGQREMAWREVARRIAHEIKNPLTPIKLSAQRLQRRMSNYRGKEAQILKECTDTIIKHTDELKEMVNEFSSFARFPEVTPTPNNLNEALGEVIRLYQQAHPTLKFEVEFESHLPVFEFDRDQIKRVLINLLDNSIAAITNQPKRSNVIRLETHFHDQLQIAVIIVKDTGPGMSEEVKARVFEPYFSTKSGGTGLGLAIAKRIINDHEGFIRVQSAPNEGAQFVIELPTVPRDLSRNRTNTEVLYKG